MIYVQQRCRKSINLFYEVTIYKLIFLLLYSFIVVNSTYGQSDIEEMRNYTHDMGNWIGMRSGFQTNGGPISERLTGSLVYEYRYSQKYSIPVELQLFKHHKNWWNGISQLSFYENRFAMSIAFKARIFVPKGNIFLQGGLQAIAGSGLSLMLPYYGIGLEIFIKEKISFYVNVQKNIIPDYKYFLLAGFNYQISSMLK